MGADHNTLRQTRSKPRRRENDQQYYRRTKRLRITHEQLLERIHYDPTTGVFTHLQDKPRGKTGFYARAGTRADKPSTDGYRDVEIAGKTKRAHVVARFYMTGKWPETDTDHINNKRDDNRWKNLRSATRSQNAGNSKLRINNSSGYRGVHWDKKNRKWMATIKLKGQKTKYLGSSRNIDVAARMYCKAAEEHWGEYFNVH